MLPSQQPRKLLANIASEKRTSKMNFFEGWGDYREELGVARASPHKMVRSSAFSEYLLFSNKRTFAGATVISGFAPKTDIPSHHRDVRLVPKQTNGSSSLVFLSTRR
jgi:hypothetical protein